jgi:hypothetical protein
MKKKSPIYTAGRGLVQSRIPADQVNQQLSQKQSVDLTNLSPSVDSCVISTYETRPINALDFSVFSTFIITNTEPFKVSYTVPDGRIALIKNFSSDAFRRSELASGFVSIYGFYENAAIAANNIVLPGYTFTVDDQPVTGFANIVLGLKIINHPVHIVATAGQIISLTMKNVSAGFTEGTLSFTGQTLLATGRPSNYEQGTLYPLPVRKVL